MKDQLGAAAATQCYSSAHKSPLKLSKTHPPTHRLWLVALGRLLGEGFGLWQPSAATSLTPFLFLLTPLYLVCYGRFVPCSFSLPLL
jgi:hypothetical protein